MKVVKEGEKIPWSLVLYCCSVIIVCFCLFVRQCFVTMVSSFQPLWVFGLFFVLFLSERGAATTSSSTTRVTVCPFFVRTSASRPFPPPPIGFTSSPSVVLPTKQPTDTFIRHHSLLPLHANHSQQSITSQPHTPLLRLLVVGGSRNLGQAILRRAHNSSLFSHIHSISRKSNTSPPPSGSFSLHSVDALDRQALIAAVKQAQPDVVVSCLGSRWNTASIFNVETASDEHNNVLVDLAGNTNLLSAFDSALSSPPYFVLVSAVGAGDSEGYIPGCSVDSLRCWLTAKTFAENAVRSANEKRGLPYTVLRACPLYDGEKQVEEEEAIVSDGPAVYGTLSREALAKTVLECIGSYTRTGGKDTEASTSVMNKTLCVVGRGKVLHAHPFVRPYENYEPLPFSEVRINK
eukprot:GHVS01064407.1.p1 GENE.GHVS01064407.1~~GHVS01064407.1.p1  ORF type:complete len:405 (+),score=74.34 GHVS01064407.1:58-1272(+)